MFDDIERFGRVGRKGAPGAGEDAAGGVDDEDFFRARGRGAAEAIVVVEAGQGVGDVRSCGGIERGGISDLDVQDVGPASKVRG